LKSSYLLSSDDYYTVYLGWFSLYAARAAINFDRLEQHMKNISLDPPWSPLPGRKGVWGVGGRGVFL